MEVLEALKEATHLGVEIHLKILQSLPSLIQNYGDYLSNDLIAELLLICYILQGGNKIPVVVNTALATLQQLIISVFDKVAKEDSATSPLPKTFEVPIENNDKVLVSPAAYDALRVFFDICSLIERQKPVFLKFGHLPETVSLELIESILTSHSEIFSSHSEFRYVIRTRAVPLLLRTFSEKSDFPVTVRVTRILYLIIRRLLPVLNVECEVILSMLIHMLDQDSAPYWKRVLCMEVFQGVSLEFSLIENIYLEFDAKDGRRPIIKGWVAALDKMSSEKPNVIGLGNTSTPMDIPDLSRQNNSSSDSSNNSPGPITDLSQMVGLSSKTSLVRSSCIDLLDKTEPPNLPPSYLYYMALSCVNSISEGVARAVLSATSETTASRKKHHKHPTLTKSPSQTELNQELLKNRSRSSSPRRTSTSNKSKGDGLTEHLSLVSSLLESIWPELLSSFDTFFRATMDSEMYHTLVRSAQKFTHASGVLLILQPRDAYLTLLGRYSVSLPEIDEKQSSAKHGILSMEGLVGSLSPTMTRENSRSSTFGSGNTQIAQPSSSQTSANIINRPKLTSRNILSFRALLNLGIALGPTLGSGWNIIFETIQYVDFLVYGSFLNDRRRGSSSSKIQYEYNIENSPPPFSGMGSDFVTVENSIRRLIDSTKDYPSFAFDDMVSSIAGVSSRVVGLPIDRNNKYHNLAGIGNAAECDPAFLLDLLGSLCYRNCNRFISMESQDLASWGIISKFLISVEISRIVAPSSRIRASQVHNEIIRQNSLEYLALEKSEGLLSAKVISAQSIVFNSLLEKVKSIVSLKLPSDVSISIYSTEAKIHVAGIDYLNKLLDNCGGSLTQAWNIVFDIIDTVFNWLSEGPRDLESQNKRYLIDRSIQLLKSGFESLQLICNDFLESLPANCIIRLIDTLYNFCHQEGDLNISFTSLSFFWIISDYLRKSLGEKISQDLKIEISNTKQLSELSSTGTINDPDTANSIWMISLLRLAAISYDPRPQVRNGAIQILFRIFDATGSQLPPRVWKACQSIVLEKVMENNPFDITKKQLSPEEITQWGESMSLIFSSIGNIYFTFLHLFIKDEKLFDQFWKRMLSYFQTFSSSGNLTVMNSVYKSFNLVLSGFIKNELAMSPVSLANTWEFWTSQSVVDNRTNANAAQECYKSLAEIFSNVRSLTPDNQFTEERVTKTTELLKSCLTYPILAPFYSDRENLSPLQAEALKQLQLIDVSTNIHTANLLILLYSDLIIQAFVKSDLEHDSKMQKSSYKTPTFISLSQNCLEILHNILKKVNPFIIQLIRQGTMCKLTISLHTIVQAKLGPPFVSIPTKNSGTKNYQLWELADIRFLEIVKASLPYIATLDNSNKDIEISKIWNWFAKCTVAVISPGKYGVDDKATLSKAEALKYEEFDLSIYNSLISLFFNPSLQQDSSISAPIDFWSTLLQSLFFYSLIYHIPRLEPILCSFSSETSNSNITVSSLAAKQVRWLLGNTFFGSTDQLSYKPRQNLAFTCLSVIAKTARTPSCDIVVPREVRDLANRLLTLRLAMVLYLYITDHPLRGHAPMPKVQRRELLFVLKLVVDEGVSSNPIFIPANDRDKETCALITLYPLFVRAIPIAEKDTSVLHLLQRLLLKIGKAHSIIN